MPWTTLGLDPAGATERDVKRAYAKLLKTCRPDQDPEGFGKLHEAYQTALFELQWRNADEGVESARLANAVEMPQAPAVEELDDRAVATDPERPPTRQAWAEEATAVEMSPGLRAITGGFDRLESALASGADDIPSLVSRVEALLYEHPSEVHRWGGFMHELFARHGDHPALGIKPDTILFELEHGGAAASLAVIDRLDRRGSTQGITNLASLLLQNKARIPTPAAGIAAARLAGAAAFWARGSTGRLADFAYEHLARGERDFHMQLIDRHSGMAHMMALVPVTLKSFWRQRLMHTAGSDSWDDEESKAALDWLKTPQARSGPCFEVFVDLLPEELAKTAKATPEKWQPYVSSWSTSSSSGEPATQVDRGGPRSTSSRNRQASRSFEHVAEWERDDPGAKGRKRERFHAPASGMQVPAWAWGLIVVFVLKIVLAVASSVSRPSSSPVPGLNRDARASLEQYDPEMQRRIKEGAEKFRHLREERDRTNGLLPEAPSGERQREPRPGQGTTDNPLFQDFQNGTR